MLPSFATLKIKNYGLIIGCLPLVASCTKEQILTTCLGLHYDNAQNSIEENQHEVDIFQEFQHAMQGLSWSLDLLSTTQDSIHAQPPIGLSTPDYYLPIAPNCSSTQLQIQDQRRTYTPNEANLSTTLEYVHDPSQSVVPADQPGEHTGQIAQTEMTWPAWTDSPQTDDQARSESLWRSFKMDLKDTIHHIAVWEIAQKRKKVLAIVLKINNQIKKWLPFKKRWQTSFNLLQALADFGILAEIMLEHNVYITKEVLDSLVAERLTKIRLSTFDIEIEKKIIALFQEGMQDAYDITQELKKLNSNLSLSETTVTSILYRTGLKCLPDSKVQSIYDKITHAYFN